MSYRSFKRVLGETSLERKCRFLFGACLLLLITGSFWWYGNSTERLVYEQSRQSGRSLVEAALQQAHLIGLEDRSEVWRDLARVMSEELKSQAYETEFLVPSEEQSLSREERAVLKYYLQTPREEALETRPFWDRRFSHEGRFTYQYYQPIYAKRGCISCHPQVTADQLAGSTDRLTADRALAQTLSHADNGFIAVARVSLDDAGTRKALNMNRAVLLATAIVTVFLAMIASYVIVRYVIVKPLKHLRDVSDAVSRGNIEMRAEIHTADEFEELGVAFNRMLRNLVATQEELRQVNVNLDGKVDELAQMNMRLYEMNRLRSDFLATMSHELRTPLNSIIGFSDVLGSIDALNDKQKRYVQNIQKSGRMLLDMINDILDLAKIESGKMELRLADFAIEQVVSAQCELARPLAERKNIDLECEIEPGLPLLHQDQAKLQQILNNLLSNAIKFTPEAGRIQVKAYQYDQDNILLTVSDTGVGIAEEDQTTIFEKFRQGRTVLPGGDAMTREYSGTGLGLSIVKELCKLLGGEVSVQSELGKGSTFTVRLPVVCSRAPKSEVAMNDGLDEVSRALQLDFARPPERPSDVFPASTR